ncbi:MAG: acyl carrier protein [Thioploca sp.]|nr:acyl carrier protein [Thioploca sp.]
MVELCARLSQSFGLEIPVTGLIANPTVSSMARYLEQLTAVAQSKTTTGSLFNTAAKQKAALSRQRQLAQLRRKPNV